ncbi:MAG TPA: hypothetical protein VKF17_17620, partial [Isosphaeraceae bacterium]|nr:hypothetical protein [Isosphaeraceae bacterium]
GLIAAHATEVSGNGAHTRACQGATTPISRSCACKTPKVTESLATARTQDLPSSSNGRPDFATMSPADRLVYHRRRLGLGR